MSLLNKLTQANKTNSTPQPANQSTAHQPTTSPEQQRMLYIDIFKKELLQVDPIYRNYILYPFLYQPQLEIRLVLSGKNFIVSDNFFSTDRQSIMLNKIIFYEEIIKNLTGSKLILHHIAKLPAPRNYKIALVRQLNRVTNHQLSAILSYLTKDYMLPEFISTQACNLLSDRYPDYSDISPRKWRSLQPKNFWEDIETHTHRAYNVLTKKFTEPLQYRAYPLNHPDSDTYVTIDLTLEQLNPPEPQPQPEPQPEPQPQPQPEPQPSPKQDQQDPDQQEPEQQDPEQQDQEDQDQQENPLLGDEPVGINNKNPQTDPDQLSGTENNMDLDWEDEDADEETQTAPGSGSTSDNTDSVTGPDNQPSSQPQSPFYEEPQDMNLEELAGNYVNMDEETPSQEDLLAELYDLQDAVNSAGASKDNAMLGQIVKIEDGMKNYTAWFDDLENFIKSKKSKDIISYMKPNKRLMPLGIVMPSAAYKKSQGIEGIRLYMDISYSMPVAEIKILSNIVYKAAKHFKNNVKGYVFNTELTEIDLKKVAKDGVEIYGGTKGEPILESIKLQTNKKLLFLILSDGQYSEGVNYLAKHLPKGEKYVFIGTGSYNPKPYLEMKNAKQFYLDTASQRLISYDKSGNLMS